MFDRTEQNDREDFFLMWGDTCLSLRQTCVAFWVES